MGLKFKSAVAIKGIFTRLIFAVHGFVAVWRVVTVKDNAAYWLMIAPLIGLFIELIITLKMTEKGEWKWVCPSVLIYISSAVPALCILELDLVYSRIAYAEENNIEDCSAIDSSALGNQTLLSAEQFQLALPIILSDENWNLILQQILLFILIIGRWLLPKGNISRDQLSQLLLVYIGMAADILEFSTEGLKEDAVECNKIMVYLILTLWAWSLIQFTLVLTATKVRKPRLAGTFSNLEEEEDEEEVKGSEKLYSDNEGSSTSFGCCETEVWGISTGLCMQDGPFLVMRLYILLGLRAVNHMMIFFTCKNALIFCLQIYRLIVLFCEKWKKRVQDEKDRVYYENHPPISPSSRPSSVSHVDVGTFFQQSPMKIMVARDWHKYLEEGKIDEEGAGHEYVDVDQKEKENVVNGVDKVENEKIETKKVEKGIPAVDDKVENENPVMDQKESENPAME